ncbi:MAG TPA: ADP-forming succinate--CoA ligase subunit beta [Candidatus Nitrosotenuis sp.]|nr:ADP-forming succinate--CoA ligase subunit beta [Candidatus Nitrosotenuis sp.]
MNIHEYQGKEILARLGLPVPRGRVAAAAVEAEHVARELGGKVAVKAQVHTGGRGKAGGIKVAHHPEEARRHAETILGMKIKGLTVEKVLVEEGIDIEREFYLGITLDRARARHVVMFSPMGGMDIEEVARQHPEAIFRFYAHPHLGLQEWQGRQLAHTVDLTPHQRKELMDIVRRLFTLYADRDCTLVEINPLAILKDGRMVCADTKVSFDENALFRHPDLEILREVAEEDPLEREAQKRRHAYVHLSGEVGVIGNGAGLVMSTLDEVSRHGGRPANFLDIGGGARAPVVKSAVELVLMDPQVKGLLFNIFGGITRGDEVARGIIEGLEGAGRKVPVVIRLSGTNEEEGRALLRQAGYETAATMDEAARKIVELTR